MRIPCGDHAVALGRPSLLTSVSSYPDTVRQESWLQKPSDTRPIEYVEVCTAEKRTDRLRNSISNFGQRANFGLSVLSLDPSGTSTGGAITYTAGDDNVDAAKTFEQLLKSVDNAFAAQQGLVQDLHRHEDMACKIAVHAFQHYRVHLPSRPMAITIRLNRTAGLGPLKLYGSTSTERPTSENHEMVGQDEALLYEHVLRVGQAARNQDENEDGFVDRRKAVPKCRELYVTVVAERTPCDYKISVSFESVKIRLTRHELAKQVESIKGAGWEARVRDMHQDPVKKALFDDRIQQIKDDSAKKRLQQLEESRQDFVRVNKTVAGEGSQTKLLQSEHRALKALARQEAAQQRRQGIDKQMQARCLEQPSNRDAKALPPISARGHPSNAKGD